MIYFKLPFSEKLFTVEGNSSQPIISFVSFDESQQLDFSGSLQEISYDHLIPLFSDDLPLVLPIPQEESQENYLNKLEQVIEFIKEQELKKLVISRQKILNFTKNINLTNSFLNLCKAYPNAFVYLFFNGIECWLGAFSEVLGKYHKKTQIFETMSLAGTLPLSEMWSKKEYTEQQTVTDYIQNILLKYSALSDLSISHTYNHISGNIKHLRTDFSTKITPSDLQNIIQELHPTPAVCGIPKTLCKEAISFFEEKNRSFYSGYIRIEDNDFVQYFVNLRCSRFTQKYAQLFVGGGITAESSPQKEWQETQLKSEVIINNLSFSS